jgi:hypothetical protein
VKHRTLGNDGWKERFKLHTKHVWHCSTEDGWEEVKRRRRRRRR